MEPRALADRDPAQPQRPPLQEAAQHCRIRRRRRLRRAGSSSSSVSSLSTSSPSSLAVATPPFASPSPTTDSSPRSPLLLLHPLLMGAPPRDPQNPNRIHPPTLPLPSLPPSSALRAPRSAPTPPPPPPPVAADPFTAALAECARDQSGGDLDRLWGARRRRRGGGGGARRRSWRLSRTGSGCWICTGRARPRAPSPTPTSACPAPADAAPALTLCRSASMDPTGAERARIQTNRPRFDPR
uniref:Uncharacterized protein n=1 Tax=Ananas comosus var. bracteatus TaxID=296719 RepID=A0A6V7QGU6_ANACO|nr:unnamed protein product [Ananas comosus var. bracteatus]